MLQKLDRKRADEERIFQSHLADVRSNKMRTSTANLEMNDDYTSGHGSVEPDFDFTSSREDYDNLEVDYKYDLMGGYDDSDFTSTQDYEIKGLKMEDRD